MTKKKENIQNKEEKTEELKYYSVRQFFYINKQLGSEDLIKTLERTYREYMKTEGEWEEIMINKKIIFK